MAVSELGMASHAQHCTAFSTVHNLCGTQSHLLSYMPTYARLKWRLLQQDVTLCTMSILIVVLRF